MATLVDFDSPKLGAVTVFHVDLARGYPSGHQALHRASHLRASFAGTDHEDILVSLGVEPKVAQNGLVRIGFQ
jgi:hypothetical protein